MQPYDAFNIIYKDINEAFDYKVVKAFYQKLEFYPVNSAVQLSDKRIAIVVETSGSLKLRPVVAIYKTGEVLNLASAANKDISIERALNRTELPK
jgi:hypothetical protein